MVNWKSPEEAEAWWNEFQELKKKVNEVEKRLIDSAKNEINTSIAILIGILPHDKRRYLNKRRQHYAELRRKSKNEKEAFNHSEQFLEEVLTYLNSS